MGPGQTYTELYELPWNDMAAGDVVNVFYRDTPYAARIGLRVEATAEAPFYLHGVADKTSCQRPVLTGIGARPSADQQANNFGQFVGELGLGLVTLTRGPLDGWDSHRSSWIIIENLRFEDVGAEHTFINNQGAVQNYADFSAAIYAVRVAHLKVRNCEFVRTALGVFVNSRGQSSIDHSEDVHLVRNRFEDNGHVGSETIHSTYVQARRALYEGNDMPQLRLGAIGSTLKDRSSGTVVRFNRIVANARALDLVETEEEEVPAVQLDPLYPHAWVYGNLIINDVDQPNKGATNMVHFGYDNSQTRARTGTLYFYGNTVIQSGPQSKAYYAHVFQVSTVTPDPQVQAWRNLFANLGTVEFRFMSEAGQLQLRDTNIAPVGWVARYPGTPAIVTTSGGKLVESNNTGLTPEFKLQPDSIARNQAQTVSVSWPDGVDAEQLGLTHQFDANAGLITRSSTSALGAFE